MDIGWEGTPRKPTRWKGKSENIGALVSQMSSQKGDG
jgi:hypothetical protein